MKSLHDGNVYIVMAIKIWQWLYGNDNDNINQI